MDKAERYIKQVKDFCDPESYGKGLKILGSGAEGVTTEFRLNNDEIIVFKGTIIQEKRHRMLGEMFTKKQRKKIFNIWKKIAKKSDYIIKPYRQEFCYLKILRPVEIELVAMEYGGIDAQSFIIKNKKQSVKWWKCLNEQLLEILDLFKKLKVTHGDMKLENIVLTDTKRPRIKVIDFSFASDTYDKKSQSDLQRLIAPFVNRYPAAPEEYGIYKKMPKEIRKFWMDYAKQKGVDTTQIRFK